MLRAKVFDFNAGCITNEKVFLFKTFFLRKCQGFRAFYERFKHSSNNNGILAQVIDKKGAEHQL